MATCVSRLDGNKSKLADELSSPTHDPVEECSLGPFPVLLLDDVRNIHIRHQLNHSPSNKSAATIDRSVFGSVLGEKVFETPAVLVNLGKHIELEF